MPTFAPVIAEVAQLVEHNLATALKEKSGKRPLYLCNDCPGGGIGRRARFRCEWLCGRAGSSPVLGTPLLIKARMVKLVDTLL